MAAVVRLYLLYCRKERLLAFDFGTLYSDHRGSAMVFVWCRLKRNESQIATDFNFRCKIVSASITLILLQKHISNVLRRS